ncbi:MAG: oligoendopeptidase F [Spartobacteria bacterium AMD-G4]|nr:MAG: oligoendopeptidase F [Spartobacteria bacterium AMD-G4]
MSSAHTPLRTEVSESDKWDLTPLYTSDEGWEEDFSKLQNSYEGVANFRGKLGESPSSLAKCLEFEKGIDLLADQLNQYAALSVSGDSSHAEALSREARLESLMVRVGEAFSFLSPEIQEIPDDTFAAFLADPALADWTIPLQKLRRRKLHTLSAAEERLLALGSSAVRGHSETFSQLTNVDMLFGTLKDSEGNERELTQSSFSSFLQQREPSVRKAAFHQFYKEFSEHRFTLAASLANSVRADVFYARARNYPSAREAALFADDVPTTIYDNLISTVRGNLDALFRYFELRRRVLKLEEIHHYDTYVTMVENVKTDVVWDEAVERVTASLTPLGSEYTNTLAHGLRGGRWCDRYENKGKRSGAFSYGTYTSPPYIMMNYKADVFSDVYTLAHEAGHSMHTWYARGAQLYQNYGYPIFLAEVASTFNEVLLTEHLLKTTDDRSMKAFILNRQIDDIRGTLYRQTMFAEFEHEAHAAEEAGEALTLENFKAIYRKLLNDYFGPSFAIDGELELECLRIPHFYNAFYVYKYATGLSAAVALATQVLETGDATRYLGFLKSGGSRFPVETLREAGVDMSTPAPVQATLDLFSRRVAELEALIG